MSIIRQWFGTMNEVLDDLILRYPGASGEERFRMQEQWEMLKALSDDMIESWLSFEDKMALYRDLELQQPAPVKAAAAPAPAEHVLAVFQKGQGYFQLHMFGHAAEQLEETVRSHPEFIAGRLYLAMSRMHLKEWNEAQRHFQLISTLTDEPKLIAIAYNALGCIQAIFAQLEQARTYFRKSLETDPSFCDPRRNLESCLNGKGQILLQFGSAELQTICL
ncbi:tetratricopeptide repeat protein [Cohnella faecalis]|uniref:Tetratricopeptide repeat protein n=1 Tax=Cohnella faecalis TaxID=2315694 RepID=A0A398CQD5_9BACL|nr:tetratricopeptide repeat protein [Cohnella faecalis]RIE04682.1 tetratricopeptide repeat protein [Cohnella faecalis]